MNTIKTDISDINKKTINQSAWESIQEVGAMFGDNICAES